MRGLTAFTSAAPSPSLSSAPGRYASRNTSDLAASLRKISTASSRLRSSTRLRLLRLSATKLTLSPLRIGGVARPMSPCGGSILITSAPMSASSVPASGPAMKFASSITLIPASGFGMWYPLRNPAPLTRCHAREGGHPVPAPIGRPRRGRASYSRSVITGSPACAGDDTRRMATHGSLNLQSGLVDDLLVHRDLARDARAKNLRPLCHHRQAGLDELLPHVRASEDGGELLGQPVDDGRRCSRRRVDALEGVGFGVLDTELVE